MWNVTDYAYVMYCYSKRQNLLTADRQAWLVIHPRDGFHNINVKDLSLLMYSLANLQKLNLSPEYFEILDLKVQQYAKDVGDRVLSNILRCLHKRASKKLVSILE